MKVTWKFSPSQDGEDVVINFIVDGVNISENYGKIIVWTKLGKDGFDNSGFKQRGKGGMELIYTDSFLFYKYYDKIIKDLKKFVVKHIL